MELAYKELTYIDQYLIERFNNYNKNIVAELSKMLSEIFNEFPLYNIEYFNLYIKINDIYDYVIDLSSDETILESIISFNYSKELIKKIFSDEKKLKLFELIDYGRTFHSKSQQNFVRLEFVDKIPDNYVLELIEIIESLKRKSYILSITEDTLTFKDFNINSSSILIKISLNNLKYDIITAKSFIGIIAKFLTLKSLEE